MSVGSRRSVNVMRSVVLSTRLTVSIEAPVVLLFFGGGGARGRWKGEVCQYMGVWWWCWCGRMWAKERKALARGAPLRQGKEMAGCVLLAAAAVCCSGGSRRCGCLLPPPLCVCCPPSALTLPVHLITPCLTARTSPLLSSLPPRRKTKTVQGGKQRTVLAVGPVDDDGRARAAGEARRAARQHEVGRRDARVGVRDERNRLVDLRDVGDRDACVLLFWCLCGMRERVGGGRGWGERGVW